MHIEWNEGEEGHRIDPAISTWQEEMGWNGIRAGIYEWKRDGTLFFAGCDADEGLFFRSTGRHCPA